MTPARQPSEEQIAQAERDAAARILARSKPICQGYARRYTAWVNAPEKERDAKLAVLRTHVQICVCRVYHAPADSSWIFAGETMGEEE